MWSASCWTCSAPPWSSSVSTACGLLVAQVVVALINGFEGLLRRWFGRPSGGMVSMGAETTRTG